MGTRYESPLTVISERLMQRTAGEALPTLAPHEWLQRMAPDWQREGGIEAILHQMHRALSPDNPDRETPLRASLTPERVGALFRGEAPPSLIEQSLLVTALRPDSRTNNAFTAACREGNAQGSGKA